jgi:hypothetical protein
VNRELGKKCKLICQKLRDVGITDFYEPKGGYFVWVKSKGKMTGKGGQACTIHKDKCVAPHNPPPHPPDTSLVLSFRT